jgi:shikimate kinase
LNIERPMEQKSIALIGFMGTGKTTIGWKLAKRLRREFIDVDSVVEHRAGMPIGEIFRSRNGEKKFRGMESGIMMELSGRRNLVLSCGGGVVLNDLNVQILKGSFRTVLLQAAPEAILERLGNDAGKRPLISNVPEDRKMEEIKSLLRQRQPLYEEAADIVVDTTNRITLDIVWEAELKLRLLGMHRWDMAVLKEFPFWKGVMLYE